MRRRSEAALTERRVRVDRGGRRGIWIGAAIALVCFVLIAVVGSWPGVVALNADALRAFQAAFPLGSVDAVSLLLVFGSSQISLLLLGVGAVWLWAHGNRLVALSFGLVLVGVAIEVALKATLGHPLVWGEFSHGPGLYPFPEVKPTVVTLSSPFPSGHVLRSSYLALTATAVLGRGLSDRGRAALRGGAGLLVLSTVFGVLYL